MNLSSDRSRNVMSLADYLQTERKDREPSEITVLHLDYTKATEIEGLTDEYVNLEILTLVCVGLQSLKGLPSLPALKQLDLTGNSIASGLEILVANCPSLESLTLNGNPIEGVDSLNPLAQLSHLSSLDLYDCPVHETEGLKETVFQMIPHLKYLDGMDINNVEEPDDDEGDEEEDDEYVEVSEEGDEEEEYEAGGYAETEESNTNQSGARGENQGHFNHLAGRSRGEDDPEFVPEDDQEGDDEDADESEGDDEEGGEGEEESYTEEDSSAPNPRGPKRKYPFPVSEEEYTGDSAPGNE